MEDQENKYDVTLRIIEAMKCFIKKDITPITLSEIIASEVEMYANSKVLQFIEQKNEISNTNE